MPIDELGVGEVGFVVANIKTVSDAQDRRHDHRSGAADRRAVPRLQGSSSRWCSPACIRSKAASTRAARRAREAAAERRVVLLRAGDLGGARLRLPLRLPRPAAHGDRPGAARARVQPRPGHDRAGRALSRDDDRRRGRRRSTARRSCRTPAGSTKIEEPIITAMILTPSEYVGGDPAAAARTSAASRRSSSIWRPTAC